MSETEWRRQNRNFLKILSGDRKALVSGFMEDPTIERYVLLPHITERPKQDEAEEKPDYMTADDLYNQSPVQALSEEERSRVHKAIKDGLHAGIREFQQAIPGDNQTIDAFWDFADLERKVDKEIGDLLEFETPGLKQVYMADVCDRFREYLKKKAENYKEERKPARESVAVA